MCTYNIFKAVLRRHDLNLPVYCWSRVRIELYICSPEKLLRKAVCPSTCSLSLGTESRLSNSRTAGFHELATSQSLLCCFYEIGPWVESLRNLAVGVLSPILEKEVK